jgi:hypothetical protein
MGFIMIKIASSLTIFILEESTIFHAVKILQLLCVLKRVLLLCERENVNWVFVCGEQTKSENVLVETLNRSEE